MQNFSSASDSSSISFAFSNCSSVRFIQTSIEQQRNSIIEFCREKTTLFFLLFIIETLENSCFFTLKRSKKEKMSLATRRFHSASSSRRKYYQIERSPYSNISSGALSYQPTDRIENLAKPKFRRDSTIRDGKKTTSTTFFNVFLF